MIFEQDNIRFIIQNLIKVGRVSSVNEKDCTARVVFENNTISYDLPVLQNNTLKNKDYVLPDVGEQVVCLFLPTSYNGCNGFIIGAIYSMKYEPAVKNKDKRHIKFSDGTEIEYDRKEHILKVDCKGEIIIKSTNKITIYGDMLVNGDIYLTGNIKNS